MKKNNARVSQQKAKRALKRKKRKKSYSGPKKPSSYGTRITDPALLPENVQEWVRQKEQELGIKVFNDNPESGTEEENKDEQSQ